MTARPSSESSRRTLAAVVLLLAATLGACGSAAAPSPSPTSAPTPTPVPGASGPSDGGAIGGGGATGGGGSGSGGGSTGGGIVDPPCCKQDPLLGQATSVVPQPGQHDLVAVNVQLVRADVTERHVTVELRWWSGVAPCSVLDSVQVERDGTTFTLTPREGSSGQPVTCVDIAQLKATVVDLGVLEVGDYIVRANGDAQPITVEVR